MNPDETRKTIESVPEKPVKKLPFSIRSEFLKIGAGVLIAVLFFGGAFILGRNTSPKTNDVNFQNTTIETTNSSPTIAPDETTDWKMFTNQKYSYSIKYPNNLAANEQNNYYHYVEFSLPKASDGSSYMAPYLISVIADNFTVKDPAAYNYMSANVINSFFTMKSGDVKKIDTSTFTKLSDVIVAGQTGIAVSITATGINQQRVYLKHNGNIYMISDSNTGSVNFKNLLSTFKFTDQASSITNTSTWKAYTNSISTATIKYPTTWTVKESHWLSNRTVDDPKEINTAILSGKEGEIKIQWGSMGFGGGCDQQYQKTVAIKNGIKNICLSDDKGNRYWSFISNEASDDKITETNATAYPPLATNSKFIETMLSTLELTK